MSLSTNGHVDEPPTKRAKMYTDAEIQKLVEDAVAKQLEPLRDTFFCNDPVHGTVQLPYIAKRVVDTKIFQRMRHIRQLSTVHFVYPGAVHCRFMHSIGTAHLAYNLIKTLRQKQPELHVTVQDILCVTLAGLCHDLGHPCFSHMFEVFMHEQGKQLRAKAMAEAKLQGRAMLTDDTETLLRQYESWNHEEASVKLLKELFKELAIPLKEAGLREDDLQCILELVDPPKKALEALLEQGQLYAKWSTVIRGRPIEKAWIYEIVSNWRSGVDVDKFDYFKRDAHFLGITNPFRHDRFIASIKVLGDSGGVPTISPPEKEQDSLRDNFCEIRKFLHSQAYSHKTSLKLANHMIDILMMLDDNVRVIGADGSSLRMSEAALVVDPLAYLTLTDTFVEAQLLGCDAALETARCEYEERFIKRKLMRLIAGWDVPLPGEEFCTSAGALKLPGMDNIISEVLEEYVRLSQELDSGSDKRIVAASELRCQVIRIHGGMGERDPIARIHFHSKQAGAGILALAEGQSPPLRRRLFMFWNPGNEADTTTLQRLTQAFKSWAGRFIEKHEDGSKPLLGSPQARSPQPRKRTLRLNTSIE